MYMYTMVSKFIVASAGLLNEGLGKKLNLKHWLSNRKNLLRLPKSGFNTVRLEQVRTHCFSRQADGATLGHIFFIYEAQSLTNSGKSLGIV